MTIGIDAMLIIAVLITSAVLLGSVQTQSYEGDVCGLPDGSRGICKDINECEETKESLRKGNVNINICSFKGWTQIVCCGDKIETPPVDPIIFQRGPSQAAQDRFAEACRVYADLPRVWRHEIIGGKTTSNGEFPHQVALAWRDPISDVISFTCGGTIISSYYILTAAHCTVERQKPTFVRMGTVDLTTEQNPTYVDIEIQEIIQYPNYSFLNKTDDIALLRLQQKIQFTTSIRPACLNTDIADFPPSTEMIVTGWGTTDPERSSNVSNVLLKTSLTTMARPTCNTTLFEYNKDTNLRALRNGIDHRQYCAWDPSGQNDACQGDSGGPLQVKNSQTISVVGIVSFGIGCGTKLPGVYTRVAYYLDWISSIVYPNA